MANTRGRPKGRAKSGGRVKGTPNKLTRNMRELILNALDEAGGQAYLAKQARLNPVAFLTLLGKLLPHEFKTDVDGLNVRVYHAYKLPRIYIPDNSRGDRPA